MSDKKIQEIGSYVGGAGSFQGGPYGYGGRTQLVKPTDTQPGDMQKIVADLVDDEMQDMFGPSDKPVWTKEGLQERNASDANYRDLPGFPATNTLVQKQNFVPIDPSEQDNVDFLGPTVGGVALNDIPNNTSNNWKATTPEKRGKQIIDIDALVKDYAIPEGAISGAGKSPGSSSWSSGGLVAQKDWAGEREENATGDMEANNPLGGMGVIMKPQRFIPDSAENQVRMEIINPQGSNMTEKDKKDSQTPESLEEAETVGSAEMNQQLIQQMIALSQKHGGKGLDDYQSVVPPAEQANMLKQGNFKQKIGGLKQAHQDRDTRNRVAAAQKNAPLVQGLKGLAGQQPKQDVKFFPPPTLTPGQQGGIKTEGAATVSNSDAAEELSTYIINDAQLYRTGIVPVIRNLKKKMSKGVYNPQLAVKLWSYVTTAAAQKYAKEFGMENWHEHFNAATRKEAAETLALHFSSTIQGA
jgi:hypothetical protein